MKTPKTKGKKKEVKKTLKNDFELSLRKKMKDFFISLGHDAEDIGAELKKASKIIAKKLGTKLKDLKPTETKNKEVKKPSTSKIAKKDLQKTTKKLTKVIVKASKKAVDKATDIEEIIKKEVIAPAQIIVKEKSDVVEKQVSELNKKVIDTPKQTKAVAKPKQTASKSVKTTTESNKNAVQPKSNPVKKVAVAKKAPVKRANISPSADKKEES